jgi:hypothetical protein
VNICCTQDSRPVWPVPIQWYPPIAPLPSDVGLPPGAQRILEAWKKRRIFHQQPDFVQDEEILQVFDEMARFSIHTAEEERRTASAIYENPDFTGTFVNIFLWHLLRAQSVSDVLDSNTTFREAVRLGLLLFLACVKRRFGLYPVTFTIHVEKLVAVLSLDQMVWQGFQHLKIWIIAMGLLEAIDKSHVGSLASEWVKTLKEEGIEDQSEAEVIVKEILWIESIHGLRYKEVRERFWGSETEHASIPLTT